MSLQKLPFLTCLLLLSAAVFGQNNIKSPNEFLPHRLGEQFTEHATLVDYFRHVAAHSNQVKLVEFGKTYQRRPQILAIVSSPENLARIEEIRTNNLQLAGLAGNPGGGTNGKAGANSQPVTVVWLGFSVHGNEAAGSEASMGVIYDLTNPDNRQAQEWLKNTVVLMEPSVNPDGYSRYTSWYRSTSPRLPDPNPAAREHDEPWPGGRVNHYLHDLNRDWAWATQIESQNRLKIYGDWLPHVVADLHEQYYDNPYYFAPAAQPYHKFLTKWQADFQVEIGKNHARYFDENGWLYFTKEVFDLLYPSYGDTYPCFNGAIGMTYEQGGHSRAGRAILLPHGDTLTLADRVAHHRTTALSTVEISSKSAGALVKNFQSYFQKSQTDPPGQYKTFIVRGTNPAHKLEALTTLLDRHQIRYGKAGKTATGVAAYDYATGSETRMNVAENDLIISAFQPKGLLAQVLFEPTADLVDSLTYDITAWSLPLAHGLETYASKQRLDPAQSGYPGDTYKNNVRQDGTTYAYLAAWNSFQSARLLAELLKKGVVVRYAEERFELNGKNFPAGTLVMTRADNRKNEDFEKTLAAAAAKFSFELTPVSTGFVDAGRDFGSDAMRLISKPNVLILSGEKTYNNEFGQVWFFFDRELEYPVTLLDAGDLASANLANFNLLVLPEGSFNFDDATLEKLNAWLSGGGRLIAVGDANRSLEEKKGFQLARFADPAEKEQAQKRADQEALDHRTVSYKDRVRASLSGFIPGAIVRVKMDASHPLAFGLKDYYFSLKTSGLRYDLLKNAWNVGYLEKGFLTNGFIGNGLKRNLENSAVFAVQGKGRGNVIYLVDNPLYRSFWEEGKLLFSNAVFLTN